MTDYGSIKEELMLITGMDSDEAEIYKSIIESCAQSVYSLLKDSESENDSRVVSLCAVKAFYQLCLMQKLDDSVTSFKAGDVSYTKDSSFKQRARELLSLALYECRELIDDDSFAFEVM